MAAIAAPTALGAAASNAAAGPMALMTAALLLLNVQPELINTSSQRALDTAVGPGQQPGSDGQPESCPVGTYKAYSGAYACTRCPDGSVSAKTGGSECNMCTPVDLRTSNAAHSDCVYRPGVPTPAPTKTLTGEAKVIAEASVPNAQTRPCEAEDQGAQRCGIPIGYNDGNNRTGAIWLPKGYKGKSMPIMVLLHGAGFDGWRMIDTFKNTANQYQYIIIAPDSRYDMYWLVPETGTSSWTHDFAHIDACYKYVTSKMPGIVVNPKFVTIVGNSRAAYAAPAFGSQVPYINSAIMIHASAEAKEMGARAFPIYWSTGSLDPLYGPDVTKGNIQAFEAARPDFKITWRVWVGSHTIRNYTELNDWSVWWLNPNTRNTASPPLRRMLRSVETPALA